ncbi:hypothetical protein RD055328_08270 [Companilactobacillus sp. RD055328]|uniref:hypothetical protein n=1 Tax=Companilactobacillus sp. RD055328 TaxID=2916634 RepID=UPI001FC8009D|nr:hypothetical protein [Companilactobacillus sp. RD055328]GKQ42904.1 hypothetical protein RD055328_08270 [Companilactobacillus sp. RD055328]
MLDLLTNFEKAMPDASKSLNKNFEMLKDFFINLDENAVKVINLARMNAAQKDAKLYVVNDVIAVVNINNIMYPKNADVMYQVPKGYRPFEDVGVMQVRNSTDIVSPVVMRVQPNGDVRILGNLDDTRQIYGFAVYAINKEN